MWIITILFCETNDIQLLYAGSQENEARNLLANTVETMGHSCDKNRIYEVVYVREMQFKIIKKDIGYLTTSKQLYKIITLQHVEITE